MGLSERRATKEFQDNDFPAFQAEIHKLVGNPVPIEIAWEELAVEGQSSSYKTAWPELYFKPIIEALRLITRDQMGRDAVKAGIKKIQIRNSKGAYSPQSAITFENGTVLVDHDLSNVDYTQDRITYVVELVEKKL